MKNLNFLFLFLLLSYSFCLNLRKNQEIPDIDSLKSGLPISYNKLSEILISETCSIKSILSLSYFKSLEKNSKVKTYLNQDPNDFDHIIKDIITTLGISNPNHAFVRDIFKNKFEQYERFYKFNAWINYNLVTTVRNDKNTIAYASLFVSLQKEKYNIIMCYGNGKFKENFNGQNAVFLGINGNWKYHETSRAYSCSSADFDDYDENYIINYINLEGFKVLGNYYNIDLPYPKID